MVALIAGTGLVGLPVLGLGVPSAAAGTACVAAPGTTIVNTNADTTGVGTLRTAITTANGNSPPGAQTICIDTTTGNVTSPIVLASSLPAYTNANSLTIQGNGATVNGSDLYSLIYSTSASTLTINGLVLTHGSSGAGGGGAISAVGLVALTGSTITNSTAGSFGGGIVTFGAVTVTNSTITGNKSTGAAGGGIAAGGSVTVMDSTISGNTASTGGGGIANIGAVTVTNSTIDTNGTSTGNGGGISGGTLVTVTNSTITGNTASAGAGGGVAGNSVTLVYATVTQNTGSSGPGDNVVWAPSGGSLTSFASVVAQPLGGGTNCGGGGTPTSYGYNLEDDGGASCGFSLGTADVAPGTASGLGGLADNGGSTLTMAPQGGSALINAVPNAHCLDQGGITIDQRGLPRPGSAGGACDTGAVQVQPPSFTKAFGAASIPLNTSTSLSFTITNPNSGTSLSGLGFTDTLPAGLVVATPNGLTGSCGGGTITATAGSGSVSLSGAALAVSASCSFLVNVTGTTSGAQHNSVTATSTEGGVSSPATADLTVASAAATPLPTRIFGATAIDTAIAVSQTGFPTDGSAGAVVLARSDFFSDALTGGPLAAKVGGPLLITPGTPVSSSLDPRVLAEIQRVLPTGKTVYILGGTAALSSNIDTALTNAGYVVKRVQGANEFATAVAVANQLGNPSTVFEATGLFFADALSAVPAAIHAHGAILLTNGTTQAPETAFYLGAFPGDTRYAIGGPLAAYGADPSAIPVYGADLYGTSAAVASTFFAHAAIYGAATGLNFPDALAGGVFMATGGRLGPMLLVNTHAPLPTPIVAYLATLAFGTPGYVFGGPLAVGADVLSALQAAVG